MAIKSYLKKPIPVKAIKVTEDSLDFIAEWSLTNSSCSVYTPITREENGLAIHTLEEIHTRSSESI